MMDTKKDIDMHVHVYEVMVIAMDNQCSNSTDVITICECRTKAEAQKAAKVVEENLQDGKYNDMLRNANYAYVRAIPYDYNADCMIGLAWDYASDFYQRLPQKWVKKRI